MRQKVGLLLCCCILGSAHAQIVNSQNPPVSQPTDDNLPKLPLQAMTDEQWLSQQVRFNKIARQVLVAASPACPVQATGNLPPGWVIDIKTDERKPKVLAVIAGTEADKAGVQPGDVIKSMDGKNWSFVFGASDSFRVARTWSSIASTNVPIEVERNGVTIPLMLEAKKACRLTVHFGQSHPSNEKHEFSGLPLWFVSQLSALSDGQIASALLKEPFEQAYRIQGSVFEDKEGTARVALNALILLSALSGRNVTSANNQAAGLGSGPTALDLTGHQRVAAASAAVLLNLGLDPQGIMPRLSKKDMEALATEKGKTTSIGLAQSAAQTVLAAVERNPKGRWYAKFGTRLPVKQLIYGDGPEPALGPLDAPKTVDEIFKSCTAIKAPVFPYTFTASGWAALDDTSNLPGQNQDLQVAYQAFLNQPYPRAFAVTGSGEWASIAGEKDAPEVALMRCSQTSGKSCYLYAFNSTVLFPDGVLASTCWGRQIGVATTVP